MVSLMIVFVFIFANISFTQAKPFTDRELMIYYEWGEESEALDIDDAMEDDDEYFRLLGEGYDKIDKKISQKYGLTTEEFRGIITRVREYELTEGDRQLLDVIEERLPPTPYTEEDKERVFREVANEYGISFYRVAFIYDGKIAEMAKKYQETGWF